MRVFNWIKKTTGLLRKGSLIAKDVIRLFFEVCRDKKKRVIQDLTFPIVLSRYQLYAQFFTLIRQDKNDLFNIFGRNCPMCN